MRWTWGLHWLANLEKVVWEDELPILSVFCLILWRQGTPTFARLAVLDFYAHVLLEHSPQLCLMKTMSKCILDTDMFWGELSDKLPKLYSSHVHRFYNREYAWNIMNARGIATRWCRAVGGRCHKMIQNADFNRKLLDFCERECIVMHFCIIHKQLPGTVVYFDSISSIIYAVNVIHWVYCMLLLLVFD